MGDFPLEAAYMLGGVVVAGLMWLQLWLSMQKDKHQKDAETVKFRTKLGVQVAALEDRMNKSDSFEKHIDEKLAEVVKTAVRELKQEMEGDLNDHKESDNRNFDNIYKTLSELNSSVNEMKGTLSSLEKSVHKLEERRQ